MELDDKPHPAEFHVYHARIYSYLIGDKTQYLSCKLPAYYVYSVPLGIATRNLEKSSLSLAVRQGLCTCKNAAYVHFDARRGKMECCLRANIRSVIKEDAGARAAMIGWCGILHRDERELYVAWFARLTSIYLSMDFIAYVYIYMCGWFTD